VALLLLGVAICLVVLLASGGHLILLPLVLLLPIGWFGRRRKG
jgi:hypothetical protein